MCTAIVESYPVLRKRRALFMAAVVCLAMLSGLPMCTQVRLSTLYVWSILKQIWVFIKDIWIFMYMCLAILALAFTFRDLWFYIYCPVWRETWRFVPPRKFMSPEGEARGRHEFSGWDKSSCLPTNWANNCLLYRKLKHDVIQRRALCRETRQGNTTSGGKHDDLFSLHVTSLDQSYFFIRLMNYMRYIIIIWFIVA